MRVFYLNYADILQIHEDVIEDSGGGRGIRDVAGIESAIVAPQASYFDHERYPTIAEKAAVLCFELVMQHPFIDGNKRVGHSAMANFLHMNGHIIDAEDDEQEIVILRLAAGETDLETYTEWVNQRLKPLILPNSPTNLTR